MFDSDERFDFPCSATFRHFYAEEYEGKPRIDYEPLQSIDEPVDMFGMAERLGKAERRINLLYALAAMRQLELTELVARRKHKPAY